MIFGIIDTGPVELCYHGGGQRNGGRIGGGGGREGCRAIDITIGGAHSSLCFILHLNLD